MELITFVVAVYNNSGSLLETHRQINSLFSKRLQQYNYELIFVNDGSFDASMDEILEVKKSDNRVRFISFTRNFGQMAAMLAGFKSARGEAIINISADLQDPISLAEEMINRWQEGSEIVICYREGRSDALMSKVFSKIAYSIMRISVPQIPKGGFDFVLMDRKVMDSFNSIDIRHRYFQGDLLWMGYKVALIPYQRLKREFGKSQYNFSKKLNNFYDAVLDSSFLPIRLISAVGFITSLIGFLYSVSIFISWSNGGTPFVGWAPIMMAILIIGGITMMMLGVLGEYIWRINSEVRKKPNYIIRDES